ncbi:Hypothetical protein, putative, partial [Bodo saltans]
AVSNHASVEHEPHSISNQAVSNDADEQTSAAKKFIKELSGNQQQKLVTVGEVKDLASLKCAPGDFELVDGFIRKVCLLSANLSESSPMKLSSIGNTALLDGKSVGFLCFAADGYLVLIIIGPHNGVTLPDNMMHDGTLNVINSDSKEPEGSFCVYSIPYDGDSVISDIVAKFVLDALRAPMLNKISAHQSVGRKFVDRLLQENSFTSDLMEGFTQLEYARGNRALVNDLKERTQLR